jgi:mannose-6-phosphate isomerase-like protein (cupin superfamily)
VDSAGSPLDVQCDRVQPGPRTHRRARPADRRGHRERHGHHHTAGQILVVTAGFGWVCTHGERPQVIRAGDVVWVPPGERHWHGGTADTIMTHLAVSLGPTVWLHEVSEDEYRGTAG